VRFSLFRLLIDTLAAGTVLMGLAKTQHFLDCEMPDADVGDAPVQKRQSNNALVPVVAILQALPLPYLSQSRSEASFLTHLMVTADTQTRRATSGQAHAAYHAMGENGTAALIRVHRPSV
jgi:hypothetical protein